MSGVARFDGAAAWAELPPEVQAAIGATALEVQVADLAGEVAFDPAAPADETARRWTEAGFVAASTRLHALIRQHMPKIVEFARTETPIVSCLGPVCRRCGCSQLDACFPSCSWAEPDLCSACVGEPS